MRPKRLLSAVRLSKLIDIFVSTRFIPFVTLVLGHVKSGRTMAISERGYGFSHEIAPDGSSRR